MSDSIKRGLLSAYQRLLRPLVRILLRHGVSFNEFAEVARRVFVAVAAQEFVVPGKKMSKSRIAIVTGLTRKDVHRITTTHFFEAKSQKGNLNRIGRVLVGWHTDTDFTGPYGVPLELPYDGEMPSFAALVQRFSGDMTPRAMLDELLRVGIVRQTESGWYKILRREYVPGSLEPDFIERLGFGIHNFIHTIDANITKKSVGKGQFERTVIADHGIRPEDWPLVDAFVRERCQAVLEEIDNWLANLERPSSSGVRLHTGVGIYHFGVDEVDYERASQDILEEFPEETKDL